MEKNSSKSIVAEATIDFDEFFDFGCKTKKIRFDHFVTKMTQN